MADLHPLQQPDMSCEELWMSYNNAHSKLQMEVAFHSLTGYWKKWVESGAKAVKQSPMIWSSCDRYGHLKPCLAFDQPETVWLLSDQPSGVLGAMQVYLDQLMEKITSSDLLGEEVRGEGESYMLTCVQLCVMVLARVAGYWDNYGDIRTCAGNLCKSVLLLIKALLDMIKLSPSLTKLRSIVLSLRLGVAFLHCLIDPRRTWQKKFMHLHNTAVYMVNNIATADKEVLDIFVTVFNQQWDQLVGKEEQEVWLDFQLDVLHMIGALFSSSMVNRELASSEKVCLLLLTLFDPRESCTPVQVLTTRVFIQVVHVLHSSLAEDEIGVDSGMMMVTFLNILSPRFHEEKLINPCIRMVITLLDAVPSLLDSEECNSKMMDSSTTMAESLKKLFVEVGCYEKICEVLKLVEEEAKENEVDTKELVCSVFRAFSAVTRNCPTTRLDFEHRVGYPWLSSLITKLITPTEAVLQEALNMVVEGEYRYQGKSHSVFNISAMKMLFHWLASLQHPLQLWLARRLHDMCNYGSHNKQRCCIAGVFSTVLRVLTNSQTPSHTFHMDVEDLLIDIVAVLGTHSMRTGELKQLIGSLRPLESGTLPTYYYRMQKSLTAMADSGDKGVAPLYYFDLRSEDTYINIPDLKRFPTSSSLSFHMWVCLDPSQARTPSNDITFDPSADNTRKKRILYSFYTNGGTGFEAFFVDIHPTACMLVVATVTKKEFITLSLKEFFLDTHQWYSISIVYNVPKRPWGKSEVQIFINGELKKIAVMRTPNFSDNFTSCLLGFGVSCGIPTRTREVTPPSSFTRSISTTDESTGGMHDSGRSSATLLATSLGDVIWRWGKVTNLNGLLNSFSVFSDALTASNFAALHKKGPNDLSLFQYKCPDTYELGNKLVLYYSAKSVKENTCLNLSPQCMGGCELNATFTGQHYITWDIKAVLGSLGGVELLFPILEQVAVPVTQRKVDNAAEDHTPPDHTPPDHTPPATPTCGWFGESEGVAGFLKLLIAMLSNNLTNQNGFLHNEGPATIAAILMKTPPTLLTVSAFQTIQELVELFTQEDNSRAEVYKHLIFDFRVWSRPCYSVRIGHIQYISNIVRHMEEWRQAYGVHYILDTIRVFYSNQVSNSDVIQLDDQEILSIREALLMILKYYLMSGVQLEEMDELLAFTAVSKDTELQEALLCMLKNLLTMSDCGKELGVAMWGKGLYLLSLIRAPNMPVRLVAIKIVSHLMSRYMSVEGPISVAFRDGSMAAAVGHMTEPDMSSAIILALTDLCVAKDMNSYTDYISHMDVFMSMLHLLRQAPLSVRNTLCQLVNSILYHTPEEILRISALPGWEIMFLWLLTSSRIRHTLPFPNGHLPRRLATPTSNQTTPISDQATPPSSLTTPSIRSSNSIAVTPSDDTPGEEQTTPPNDTPAEVTPSSSDGNGVATLHTPPTVPKSLPLHSGDLSPSQCRANLRLLSARGVSPNHTSSVEMADPAHRGRSKAFVDETTAAGGDYTITPLGELVDTRKSSRKNSLQVSTPWKQSTGEDEEEEGRAVDIVSQLFRHILWNATIETPAWKVWGKFFCQLDKFADEHRLIVPLAVFKQKLLTLLCHDITMEMKEGVDRGRSLQKLLYLSQLLEVFVISTYPVKTMSEDQEVLLLKLAHNFFPEINIQHYSRGLQEEYLKMLTSAGIFDKEVAFNVLEIEISQSACRILLGCLASGNNEYYVTASLRLEHMLKCPFLTVKDVFFIFSNLARIAQLASEEDDSEWLQYIASILRCLFSCNLPRLKLDEHLQNLPDHRMPDFGLKFSHYCTTQEWGVYMKGVLKTADVQYSEVLMRWFLVKDERQRECFKLAVSEDEKRRRAVVDNEMQYQRVLLQISDLLAEEVKRQRSADSQQRNELSVTLQRWRSTRRFFTGERGAWSSRKQEHYLWKLDRTENFSRMRMRLARNYNFNRHEDASKLRDTGLTVAQTPSKDSAAKELLAKVTKRSSTSWEEEEVLFEQLWSDANSPAIREEGDESGGVANSKERKLIKGADCHLIMLIDNIAGHLEITSKHLYFLSDQGEKNQSQTWYSTDLKIPLAHLREIHSRRYNMSRTAFEIFLVDQTNYFINFPSKKVMNSVYSAILRLRPPNLNRVGIRKPAKLLRESGLTNKWVKREITNFDYLIQLNTISGRTYNDLNQYPVFPWVLCDYTSEELDLENEAVYRDFSRPVGIQNHKLEENIRLRYEEFDDPTLGKFHFGSHYSNAAGVMHYLVRMEPFTSLHVELQSGRFDFADRQFFSIPSTWENIYRSGTDQKELVPEFFYQPEFLKNINSLDLGRLQTGETLNNVILPPWASCPEDFITKHKEALESEYVSAHLHEWIDLIFGYKQTGPEAVKACNIFNFYTYEENVNLDSIKDPKERRQIESIINNFGQTPTQLFVDPHPQRLPADSARKTQAKGFTATFTGRRLLVNLFDNLSLLKAHSVDVCEEPIVFVGTPSIQTKALFVSGNPEQLVTVNQHGLLNIHGWLPFSNSKNRPFTFQFDPNAHFDKSRWQFVGGPFAQDILIKSNLFVLSPNVKYMVTGGHWDNSFRVQLVEKAKLVARIAHHNDVVTCMALDKVGSGDHLVTGSRDTSCAIWKFGINGIQSHPLQTLYGHDSEVLCVAISTELDMVISGAKDGTCLLHTVRQGQYLHTLKPRKRFKCEIHLVAISNAGRLVVYSEDTTHRQRLIASVPPCLHLYTVNGHLLLEKELVECVNAMVVIEKYLVTGNTRGFLTFRNLFTLQQLHSLNLLEPIHCISVVLDHHSKVCTHILVGLASGKLIIVSVKDTVAQQSRTN